ncbi:MAG: outer membrane beta-barrel protein [Chitinophagaceae bacterium]
MKQIALLFTAVLLISATAVAQTKDKDSTTQKKKNWKGLKLNNRANDHFMVQLGYDGWAPLPDSIKTKGLSHSVNVYLMLDFPFKSDARFSLGLGLGIGSSNIKFDYTQPNIIAQSSTLPFTDLSNSNRFKKFKLVSTYAEVPIELRFVTDPENSDASWKIALGLKLGTLLNVHTRGKTLISSTGTTLNNYVEKQSSKNFFSSTRAAGTIRLGYGHVSLFGQYQFTSFIKDGRGPNVHPYSIGITFSGL